MDGPAADFATLMSGAAMAAEPPASPAPFGYTRDRETGEMRPKKVPGRPRAKPPALEELKAERESGPEPGAAAAPAGPDADLAPDEKGGRRRQGAAGDAPAPAYTPGRIAKGMNRLYRRAGKIVRAWDKPLGAAIIEVTRAEDDDDVTIGDAWEEVARTNPRIRRFLLRLISGGAWGQLAMAHGPIALALLMKPAVLEHLPFARLIEALADDGEDQADNDGPAGGLTPADMQQVAGLVQGLAANLAGRAAAA